MAEDNENEEERGFKIIDRRGEEKEEAPAKAEEPPTPSERESGSPRSGEPEQGTGGAGQSTNPQSDDQPDPQANPFEGDEAFAQFILSLATSAYMHLGLVPGPDGKPSERNLPLARQTIDMLSMLEAKTKGNLSAQEDELFQKVLSELRMMFVEEQKKP